MSSKNSAFNRRPKLAGNKNAVKLPEKLQNARLFLAIEPALKARIFAAAKADGIKPSAWVRRQIEVGLVGKTYEPCAGSSAYTVIAVEKI